jgi:hypothetical protein
MARLTIKDGKFSSDSYVRVTRDYACDCGAKFVITIDWPENVSVNGAVTFNNITCNQCAQPIALPEAHYYVENYRLLTK